MLMKFSIKYRLLIYLGIIIALYISSYFWGAPGQSLNMKQARRQLNAVEKELAGDPRFGDIQFLQSTSQLGKRIWVNGSLPDQVSFEYLRSVMEREISRKFKVAYRVQVGGELVDQLLDEENKE